MTYRLPHISEQINNQNGALMVIALLIMATLAVSGLLVTNDAVMESRVARNYAIHKQCVASAEAAAKGIMQGIDSIFEKNFSSIGAIAELDTVFWQPHDDHNTDFDFDLAQWNTYNIRPSVLNDIPYLNNVGAIAVLVDQTTQALTPGLSGTKMREHFEYNIFCRSEHAGAGSSEAVLVIGYRQEKI